MIVPFGVIGDALYVEPTDINRGWWPFNSSRYNAADLNSNSDDIQYLKYSPLLLDLIDSDNQGIYFRAYGLYGSPNPAWPSGKYKKFPNDPVSGFTLSEVASSLIGVRTLEQLRTNVKAKRNSTADKVKIDTLFNRYIYYWNKYKSQANN